MYLSYAQSISLYNLNGQGLWCCHASSRCGNSSGSCQCLWNRDWDWDWDSSSLSCNCVGLTLGRGRRFLVWYDSIEVRLLKHIIVLEQAVVYIYLLFWIEDSMLVVLHCEVLEGISRRRLSKQTSFHLHCMSGAMNTHIERKEKRLILLPLNQLIITLKANSSANLLIGFTPAYLIGSCRIFSLSKSF